MSKLISDKKGADKILSLYWFVIIIIISGGVIAMAYNFYGAPFDVRDLEVGVFSDQVANCISQNGMMNNFLYDESGFKDDANVNFLENCGLTFDTESTFDGEMQCMVYADFYKVGDTENSVFEIKQGNLNFLGECYIKSTSDEDYSSLVKCDEDRIYVLDDYGNQYLVKIITAIKKADKNVKS